MEVIAADIGGTHARFAIADVADGRVVSLSEVVTLATADYASFETAWAAFVATLGRPAPRAAAIAVASRVGGELIAFTNNPWVIRPASLAQRLGVDAHLLINDFGAVGHAVAQADERDLLPVCGPDRPVADAAVVTVCGPGTGLGVAQVVRGDTAYRVIATEGGHVDYAPLDAIEDAVLARLRARHVRVSTERVVSGPGIVAIYETLAGIEGRNVAPMTDREIWTAALAGTDRIAQAALDRFCLAFGAVVGDLALAQGATAVVLAGGLGYRLRDHLTGSGFAERFIAKGRFRAMMTDIPVRLIVHPEPGLFGAAAAFSREHT